jgi:hypothetical protein
MAKKGKSAKTISGQLATALVGAALPTIAFIGKRLDDAARGSAAPTSTILQGQVEKMIDYSLDRAVKRALKEHGADS